MKIYYLKYLNDFKENTFYKKKCINKLYIHINMKNRQNCI